MELFFQSLLQLPVVQQITALPWMVQLFVVMGICRSVLKPLFSLLHTYVDATPSSKDNELLEKVEQSKYVKALSYVLDFLFSAKLLK